MKKPYTINWDEIAQEIQEEFADYSNHEARLVDSYLKLAVEQFEGV